MPALLLSPSLPAKASLPAFLASLPAATKAGLVWQPVSLGSRLSVRISLT